MKFSRQRELIRELLVNRYDHPTAARIYEEVREKDKNISFATVYRNLNLLVENGELRRLAFGNEDHFDPNVDEHHHFVCEKCGKIEDVNLFDEFIKLYKNFSNRFNGKIEKVDLTFYGICEDCK